ncbi:hypothetical protein [Clostridium thermarum]|uniref:hypothetical protein n=1 Tax=Clostridium thermarum TaxID=1716543 RepID=UPI0013D385DC|nr:hypothetical protein [Clostridium thermarum]
MAELTMSIAEVVLVLRTTLSGASDKLKEVELVDKNKIKLLISVSKLFPDIPVSLAYHSFSKGIIKFEVSTNYPTKVVQAIVNNINLEGFDKSTLSLDNNLLYVNIKEIMRTSISWLDIKDVKMRNNQLTFILTPISKNKLGML